jgi:hypothetical protein
LGSLEAEEEMTSLLVSMAILRQYPGVAGMARRATRAACRRPVGEDMGSVRLGSMLLLATLLAACSHHPITIGPVFVPPPAPVRPLVETPPPAVVPVPPIPELKPGTNLSLESMRATGDSNGDWLPVTMADGGVPPAADGGVPQATEAIPAHAPAADSATTASTDADPDHLVGLSEADAMRLLGVPKSRTDTPPSRVWTYSSTSCDLRLFFYPEIGGTSYRTLTYEIDDRDPTDTNRRNCVGGLLKNHAG